MSMGSIFFPTLIAGLIVDRVESKFFPDAYRVLEAAMIATRHIVRCLFADHFLRLEPEDTGVSAGGCQRPVPFSRRPSADHGILEWSFQILRLGAEILGNVPMTNRMSENANAQLATTFSITYHPL
jgi:hypothetical protein